MQSNHRVVTIKGPDYSYSFSSDGRLQWHKFPDRLRHKLRFSWTYNVFVRSIHRPEYNYSTVYKSDVLYLTGTDYSCDTDVILLPKYLITRDNIREFQQRFQESASHYS